MCISLEIETGRLTLAASTHARVGRAAREERARLCVALELEAVGPICCTPFAALEVTGGGGSCGGVPACEGKGALGLVGGEAEDVERRFAGGAWALAQLGGGALLFEVNAAADDVPGAPCPMLPRRPRGLGILCNTQWAGAWTLLRHSGEPGTR